MDIYSSFATRFEKTREDELSLEEYLALCKDNPAAYATAGEHMLTAIGEPEQIDTRNDPRLSRIFANKVIKVYPAFREFYGMEEVIEQVVAYFRHSAQGLEEGIRIFDLLARVRGGVSAIAARLKQFKAALFREDVTDHPDSGCDPSMERFGSLASVNALRRRQVHHPSKSNALTFRPMRL
ncbi:prkA AAA domain protein [Paraburkholderia fungorum]|uniref:PrkA AAA domain protein n=1 Tax=Paraburkholderia fungorum TaxID=134537 RepID=A0AAU8SWY6_9BURK|nr:prkA AAA domain protein [Paraburkholderia fungorum]